MKCIDVIEFLFQFPDFIHGNFNIAGLATNTTTGLVHHHTAVSESRSFALCASAHQGGTHGSSHADTNGRDIWCYILHGIIHTQTRIYGSAGTVDIHLNVPVTVSTVKEK